MRDTGRDTLTGSRIRARRVALGLKQAQLAKVVEISPSYLNLIEHNRRGIGGALLVRIAGVLDIEPALLTEGAEATMIATLREIAAARRGADAEVDRVDEFAGRFPGWARLLAELESRVGTLERTVTRLTDRMTHDPQLAASLHEMLSTVTAIRSTASILREPGEIDPQWQARFHRNMFEESDRLAEASRSLAAYLDAEGEEAPETGAPQEEVDAVLTAHGHNIAALEDGAGVQSALAALMSTAGRALTAPARGILEAWLNRYERDVARVPRARLLAAMGDYGADPFALAVALETDAACVMRRLASLPPETPGGPFGLAICDGSGALTLRKPLAGFPMPQVGAGCPLWPLYAALSAPNMALAVDVEAAVSSAPVLRAEAIALPKGPALPNRAPLMEAHMLLRPGPEVAQSPLPVGASCRICIREGCVARREPSILSGSVRQ